MIFVSYKLKKCSNYINALQSEAPLSKGNLYIFLDYLDWSYRIRLQNRIQPFLLRSKGLHVL